MAKKTPKCRDCISVNKAKDKQSRGRSFIKSYLRIQQTNNAKKKVEKKKMKLLTLMDSQQ